MTQITGRVAITVAMSATLLLSAVYSQAPSNRQRPSQDTPTFRSGVEFVQVDVVVTDAEGRPVKGLTADDFEVFENSQPQAIKTFTPVTIPIERPDPLPEGVESDVQTNTRSDGHVYMFILAGTSEAMALRTRYWMRRFLDEYFGDNDIGAVITGRTFPGDRQDFTNNRRLLLAAVDRFSGDGIDCIELANLMGMAGAMPNARKIVVWFGEPGIDPFTLIDYHGEVFPRRCMEANHAAIAAATRGNIRFYLFDPAGLSLPDMTGFDPVSVAAGLETQMNYRMLAEMTGGFAHANSNDFAGSFRRMVNETSEYYLLGFESTNNQYNGRYVRLEVKTKRPGLTVRSRSGYLQPMSSYQLPLERRPESEGTPVEAALANPLFTPGLPLRVAAAAYRKSGKDATVAISVDVDASRLSFAETNGRQSATLELQHLATDVNHKIYPRHRHLATFDLTGGNHSGTVRVVSEFDVPKGRFQVRVAAASGSEKGSVVYDVEVPDFSAPLTMSGVSLASSRETKTLVLRSGALRRQKSKVKQCRDSRCEPTVTYDGKLIAWGAAEAKTDSLVVPIAPTTTRDFAPDDTLAVYVEIYEGDKRASAVPHTLKVEAELRRVSGEVVRTVSDTASSSAPALASGGRPFTLTVPLTGTLPGTYVLYVEGWSDANAERVVTRTVPIRVR